jgi:hypothetical protein
MTCADMLYAIFDLIARFATALFGAGAGATAAYLYSRHKQAQDDRARMHGDVVAAFYVLAARLSAVENFSRKYLSEDRTAIAGPQTLCITYQYCPLEALLIRSLAFMADSDDCDFIHELSVSEAKYFNFVDALEERNRDVRTVIAAAQVQGIRLHEPIGATFVNLPAVDLAIQQNKNLVDAARSALDATLKESRELSAVIKRRFPEFPPLRAAIEEIKEANKAPLDNQP